jgi:ketosteroid isomerase-like protein
MLFVFFSCNQNSADKQEAKNNSETGFDKTAARKIIEEAAGELMSRLKNNDSTGFSEVFTSDAKVLPAGASAIEGRDAIRSFFGGFMKAGFNNLSLTTVDVWGNAEFIVEEGRFKAADQAGNEVDHGKFLKLWKLEGGKWKLFRECYNSDIPPMPPK